MRRAVPVQQLAALLALGQTGHGQHRLAAAEGQSGDRELRRHPGREARPVPERIGRALVDLHARPAPGRPQPARMDADEHPRARGLVESHDDLLAVPLLNDLRKISGHSGQIGIAVVWIPEPSAR